MNVKIEVAWADQSPHQTYKFGSPFVRYHELGGIFKKCQEQVEWK